jgi:hypothetical protein
MRHTEWLPGASTTWDPARSDMARRAGSGIIRSSLATRYQPGLTRHAGLANGATEGCQTPGHLGVRHEPGVRRGQVGRLAVAASDGSSERVSTC